MGVDYTVCTVVGIEIDKSSFFTTGQTRERGCEHPLLDEAKFCPDCGKQAWVEKSTKEPLPLYDEDDETFAGLDVVYDQRYEEDNTRFFVGVSTQMDMQCGIPKMMAPSVVEETKQKIQAALKPLGLWDESKFGIWTFVQYS